MTGARASQRYVLATPVRNELALLPELVRTIESQEPRPAIWVVVDDGSTDGSREWLDREAAARPWMIVRSAPEAATEYLGGHVARIKRWGLSEALASASTHGDAAEFAGIIDADMLVPADHYALLMEEMEKDPKLGIVSSVIQSTSEDGGEVKPDPFQRTDEPRGGTQFFRVECLEAIGGLPPWPGFDGAANVKARARGWHTKLVTTVLATQRRDMAARFGFAAGYQRRGRYAWFLGVHPLLVAGRAGAYAVTMGPDVGAQFLRGWLEQALKRAPRCPDPEIRAHYGWRRLGEVASGISGRGRRYFRRDR